MSQSTVKYPDAARHLYISLAKSIIRLSAGGFLIFSGSLMGVLAGLGFIAAEVLGIVEELV